MGSEKEFIEINTAVTLEVEFMELIEESTGTEKEFIELIQECMGTAKRFLEFTKERTAL